MKYLNELDKLNNVKNYRDTQEEEERRKYQWNFDTNKYEHRNMKFEPNEILVLKRIINEFVSSNNLYYGDIPIIDNIINDLSHDIKEYRKVQEQHKWPKSYSLENARDEAKKEFKNYYYQTISKVICGVK